MFVIEVIVSKTLVDLAKREETMERTPLFPLLMWQKYEKFFIFAVFPHKK